MGSHTPLKSDALCLGIWAGFCVLLGARQMHKAALVNPDGVRYIGPTHKRPGDYVGVTLWRRILALIPLYVTGRLPVGVYDSLLEQGGRSVGSSHASACDHE
jgi:hypothetical protein